jgi:DNA-binding PadR family transcriptional regulator
MPESTQRGALTEAVYYILLSLFVPLHGYGIMQKVEELSNHRMTLGAGTLYGAITTLLEKHWILPLEHGTDSRRKEYIISELGKEIIGLEILRLQELLHNGLAVTKGTQI